MDSKEIRTIVSQVIERMNNEDMSFPVEMSARHVHLTKEDVACLFGPGESLQVVRELSLPGFLSDKRVTLVTEKGSFRNVAVLGPERSATQVELSATDAFQLGIKASCNISGDHTNAGDVYIIGTHGMLWAKGSVIIAQAHVHMNLEEATRYHVKDGELVSVDVMTDRPITLRNVMIRVADGMHATMHIDMDEANACHRTNSTRGVLHKIAKG